MTQETNTKEERVMGSREDLTKALLYMAAGK
jgi:hypothetical protein